jgi:hypothetical protein
MTSRRISLHDASEVESKNTFDNKSVNKVETVGSSFFTRESPLGFIFGNNRNAQRFLDILIKVFKLAMTSRRISLHDASEVESKNTFDNKSVNKV